MRATMQTSTVQNGRRILAARRGDSSEPGSVQDSTALTLGHGERRDYESVTAHWRSQRGLNRQYTENTTAPRRNTAISPHQ